MNSNILSLERENIVNTLFLAKELSSFLPFHCVSCFGAENASVENPSTGSSFEQNPVAGSAPGRIFRRWLFWGSFSGGISGTGSVPGRNFGAWSCCGENPCA